MFMDYCRSKQLRPKTMASYEQTLKLFSRWLKEKYDTFKKTQVKMRKWNSWPFWLALQMVPRNAFKTGPAAGRFQLRIGPEY